MTDTHTHTQLLIESISTRLLSLLCTHSACSRPPSSHPSAAALRGGDFEASPWQRSTGLREAAPARAAVAAQPRGKRRGQRQPSERIAQQCRGWGLWGAAENCERSLPRTQADRKVVATLEAVDRSRW